MSTKTLASLALLKANLETEGHDVLDMIAPLVTFVGSKSGLKTNFSSSDLREAVLSELGLALPERAIDLLLHRLQRRGLARREAGRYSVDAWAADTAAVEEAQAGFVRAYADITENLRSFVEERFQNHWDGEEARNALDEYLDDYCIDFIRAYSAASPVPTHGKSPKNAQYLVSSYVTRLSEIDSRRFGLLVDVVKGRMLANAILGEDLVDQKQTFKGTTLFLDTPLVLRVSGLSGPPAEQLAMAVVGLGSKAGAVWRVFEHTIEEADSVLREVQRKLEYSYEGHGDVYLHAKEVGYSASDIILLRGRLLDILHGKGIEVHPTPGYAAGFQIDEVGLEGECDAAGLHHSTPTALRYDVNSIRSVYCIRKDVRPRKLEDCRAALVTSNSALARGAFNYGKRHESSREVSPAVTEYSLANLLWLKWPLQAPDIPKHVLAACCQAALRPSARLWQTFLQEVEKLEKLGKLTPDQHAFLRYESRVRDDLMELTLGDESALNPDTVMRVLSAFEEDVARPYQKELDEEKARRVSTEEILEGSREEGRKLEVQLSQVQQQLRRGRMSVVQWARKAGQAVNVLCSAIGLGLIALGLVWQVPGGGGATQSIPRWLLFVAGGGTVLLSLLSLFVGVKLSTPIGWISQWVERRVYRILATRLDLDDEGHTKARR